MTSSVSLRLVLCAVASVVAVAIITTPQTTEAQSGGSAATPSGQTQAPQVTGASDALSAAAQEAQPDTSWVFELSPEELFLRASSSGLQFQSMIAPSRRRLVADYETSLPYLLTRLDTDDARERIALEDILVTIGEPAVDPLVDAFRKEVERKDTTRGARNAAAVLGRLGDADAVDALSDARDNGDWKVRGAVAGALGRIGVADAVPALVDLLTDENEIVRKSAAFGLGRTATQVREACGCEGATTGREWRRAVEELADALDDPYYAVRYNAKSALVSIGEPALASLRQALRRDSSQAAMMALEAIGELGSEEARTDVAALLSSDDWAVRAQAARTIGMLGLGKRDRRDLERMLEEETHPFVLLRVEEALARE